MKFAFVDSSTIEYTISTPINKPLGGTQSSVCFLLKYLAKEHEVYLFNQCNNISVDCNVKIYPLEKLELLLEMKPEFVIVVNDLTFNIELLTKLKENGSKFLVYFQHYIDQPISLTFTDQKLKHLYDGYIFVSNFQKERFIGTYDLDDRKCYVLLNGIGEPFEKLLMTEQKKERVITYCSTPFRGLHLLIDIFPKVKEKYPDLKMKIFSGMNLYQESNDETIKGIIEKLKTLKDVYVSDGVSQTVLAKELENVMILAYPNIFEETSCITVLQCMAAGCIILTSDLGALKETTYDNNFLINFDQSTEKYVEEFTKKLEYILDDYDNLQNVIKKNKEKIFSNHRWENISKEFIKICNNINSNFDEYTLDIHKMEKICKENIIIQYFEFKKYKYFKNIQDIFNYLRLYGVAIYHYGIASSKTNIYAKKRALTYFKNASTIIDMEEVLKNICLLLKELNMENEMISYLVKLNKFNYMYELNASLALYYTQNNFNNASSMLSKNLSDIVISYGMENNYITDKEKYLDGKKELYNKLEKLIDIVPDKRDKDVMISNILLSTLYDPDTTAEKHFNTVMRNSNKLSFDERIMEFRKNYKFKPHEKINVGYIIPNGRFHPCSYMITKIFKNHDRNKFNIVGIDYLKDKGSSIKLSNLYDINFISIVDKNDEEAIKTILNLDLDILVDMSGHTNLNRINLLKYKPAKIVINYFAYPATYGISEVDYKITDAHACPKETEKYFVEKMLRMPQGFQCYEPPGEIKLNKNMDYSTINFCCFNNPKKFNRNMMITFSKILKLVPNSKLYLSHTLFDCNHLVKYYKTEFLKYGVSEDKLAITCLPIGEYLELYNKMHIALDSFPYNGGTISHEALYMNTPLVTIEGDTYVSRVGVSLLRNLGMHELIAKTEDEYITIAVKLANDIERLKMYNMTLREKMEKTDLLDGKSFTEHLEKRYLKILGKDV